MDSILSDIAANLLTASLGAFLTVLATVFLGIAGRLRSLLNAVLGERVALFLQNVAIDVVRAVEQRAINGEIRDIAEDKLAEAILLAQESLAAYKITVTDKRIRTAIEAAIRIGAHKGFSIVFEEEDDGAIEASETDERFTTMVQETR